jgi:hypothetical protein
VVQRWRQLPLDHALSYAARVCALVQSLADEVAQARGLSPAAVPDCGPATLMDQLTVMVYDASVISRTSEGTSTRPTPLAQDLTALRRALP